MMSQVSAPTVLIILDGFGYRDAAADNAISHAKTPTWDKLWAQMPHTLISGSGLDVGLPSGQMGNSEVGHMNLGAGRVVYQSLTRIDNEVRTGNFYKNEALIQACQGTAQSDTCLHLMALLSPGGVHSHEDHLIACLELSKRQKVKNVAIHCFLDGRDTPPQSAQASIEKLEQACSRIGIGYIASLSGRYYGMDRDHRWDRIEPAFRCITSAKGPRANSALEALAQSYQNQKTDEFIEPVVIGDYSGVSPQDNFIFANFRADRARQITQALTETEFEHFARPSLEIASFVTMTEYAKGLNATVAYPPEILSNTIGEYLSNSGKTQFRIAETEKYAHVTFFFNGGVEAPYPGEKRHIIPSPQVATYDLQPEMNAEAVTNHLCDAITSGQYDFIVCNYANGDMVGHSGNFQAAVQAVETLDTCLNRLEAAINQVKGHMLITADHGNVEQMISPESGQPNTAHTSEPVPLVYIGSHSLAFHHPFTTSQAQYPGKLSDVSPTLLEIMGLPIPDEMTGRSLVNLTKRSS